jgi:hypothetical protein
MIVVDLREKIDKTNFVVLILSLAVVTAAFLTLTKCEIIKDLDIKKDYWVIIEQKFTRSSIDRGEERIFRVKRIDNGYTFDLVVDHNDYNKYVPGNRVKYNLTVSTANSGWYRFIHVLCVASIVILGGTSVIYSMRIIFNLTDRYKRR